jgi:hypothetical protein
LFLPIGKYKNQLTLQIVDQTGHLQWLIEAKRIEISGMLMRSG